MHIKCPKCKRVMLRVLYQGHALGFRKYLICINATQFRCLRCGVIEENVAGGISQAIQEKEIERYTLYKTSYDRVDILHISENRADGTDYLYEGDLA